MQTIYFVDIENLCRGDFANGASTLVNLLAQTGCEEGDHVVVATSHYALTFFAGDRRFSGVRFLKPRSGKNGADYALVEEMGYLPVGRYDRVVLASGDEKFTASVSLIGRSTKTTVIAAPGSLSRKLAFAAHETIAFTHDMKEAA